MMKVEILVLFVSLIIPVIIANNNSLRAQTKQGVYIDRQITISGTNVNHWYGIPYAQQPIDNLRWMPPQPLAVSNGTNVAYTPNACPQKSSYGVPTTEACLTLNVYTPENATNLPVYVWIHGGSFTSGAGILYNATPFVSTSIIHSAPVVVVTINYRLGLLGFLADQALYNERSGMNNRSTTGNYGILDQMMALDWIKKNIRDFGGNPEQITIGGESAGGISTTALLTSPLIMKGTFQRAIIESGGI
jgi:carboxylesterase type B